MKGAFNFQDIKKIDLHTHIIPSECPDWNKEFGYGGWLIIQKNQDGQTEILNDDHSLFRAVDKNCYCPQARINDCDSTRVSIQVLSTVPGIGFNYWAPALDSLRVAQYLNDHIAGVFGDYKNRFVGIIYKHLRLGLCTVPLQNPKLAKKELERCIANGFVGVQIGSHICGKSLDWRELDEFWSTCEDLDCAVFVHPWDMNKVDRLQKYWFPWLLGMPHETALAVGSLLLGGVIERHPKLRICFAHGGGCFPLLMGRILHGRLARPDLCQQSCTVDPVNFMSNVWVDSLVHDADSLDFLIKKMGSSRICMGSDYPFPLGEIDNPGKHAEALESNKVREMILWKNAAEFLKLSNAFPESE